MINNIFFFKDNKLVKILEEDINSNPLCFFKDITIECVICKKHIQLKSFRKIFIEKEYECSSCRFTGEKNPFYGKKHSKETLEKFSLLKKDIYSGDKNPFFNKKHSIETKEKISVTLKTYFETNDNSFLNKKHFNLSKQKMSISQKKYYENLSFVEKEKKRKLSKLGVINFQIENPEYTKLIRRKAALASIKSQARYKMNKLEEKVFSILKQNNLEFEYSVILGNYQYDFGSKKDRILLEVHGDYWHANPKLYSKLNEVQLNKILKDKEKFDFAIKNNFKIFYIWEYDVNHNNLNTIEEIKNEINRNK